MKKKQSENEKEESEGKFKVENKVIKEGGKLEKISSFYFVKKKKRKKTLNNRKRPTEIRGKRLTGKKDEVMKNEVERKERGRTGERKRQKIKQK